VITFDPAAVGQFSISSHFFTCREVAVQAIDDARQQQARLNSNHHQPEQIPSGDTEHPAVVLLKRVRHAVA
jgi:hypothetical protein